MPLKNKLAPVITLISASLFSALSATPGHAQTAPASGLALESDDGNGLRPQCRYDADPASASVR